MVAARTLTPDRVDARASPFARALEQWLLRYARIEAARAMREANVVRKADDDAEMERELRDLIRRFGMRQVADAARGAGAPPQLVDDALAGKPVKIKWFYEYAGHVERTATRIIGTTKTQVREAVRGIVREGREEGSAPGEIARRVRTQLHGPDAAGRIHAFSPERAALIARTELVQAENAGIMAGYEATGVQEIEWLSYQDGRSGERHHERMNGKRVKLGEEFELPSGAKLRYPGDMRAPIGETANCRCTTRPVRAPKSKPTDPTPSSPGKPTRGAPPAPAPKPRGAEAPPTSPARLTFREARGGYDVLVDGIVRGVVEQTGRTWEARRGGVVVSRDHATRRAAAEALLR